MSEPLPLTLTAVFCIRLLERREEAVAASAGASREEAEATTAFGVDLVCFFLLLEVE